MRPRSSRDGLTMAFDERTFWAAKKRLSSELVWERGNRNTDLRLVSSIDVNGETQEGVKFRGRTHINNFDGWIVFQIGRTPPNSRTREAPFARVERVSDDDVHYNGDVRPLEYRGKYVRGCHIHPFDLNWKERGRIYGDPYEEEGDLPIAIELPKFRDYQAVLDYLVEEFGIENAQSIPVPPWQ